ncbi:MAG: type VI secretion system contractile sheath large subunit, partial [Reyranella sp.]|nr:type VI secretion system contractile sheath large subunit [Reyranella sp.]
LAATGAAAATAVTAAAAAQTKAVSDAQTAANTDFAAKQTAASKAATAAALAAGKSQADADTAGAAASAALVQSTFVPPPAPVPATPLGNALLVLSVLAATGPKTEDDRQRVVAPLGYFVTDILAQLDAPGAAARKPVMATLAIDQRVADIDKLLSVQLRAIMHAPNFQALEATWRGMFYLVSRAETGKMLKLFVFNATRQELLDDLDRAVDKDQSHLFKMIYEAGYGTLGGQPYSLLVGGYEVGRSAQDIEFLGKIAEIAAASHAPFITAASSSIFGLDRFGNLARPRDLEKIFEGVELVGFQSFRESEDSRYVTLVLPHVLLRLPYGAKSWPVEGLSFEESVKPEDPREFLWGNAAYLLAERITNAFSLYAWTAAIRGVEGGGL